MSISVLLQCPKGHQLERTDKLPQNYRTTEQRSFGSDPIGINGQLLVNWRQQYFIKSDNVMFICDQCEARIYTKFEQNTYHGPYHCSKCQYDLCSHCVQSLSKDQDPKSGVNILAGIDLSDPKRHSWINTGEYRSIKPGNFIRMPCFINPWQCYDT